MSAYAFRFNLSRKPRNPLLRMLAGVVGLLVLGVMLVVGLFVGAAMLLAGVVLRLGRKRPQRAAQPQHDVVEGEYRVVGKSSLTQAR